MGQQSHPENPREKAWGLLLLPPPLLTLMLLLTLLLLVRQLKEQRWA